MTWVMQTHLERLLQNIKIVLFFYENIIRGMFYKHFTTAIL